MEQESTGRQRQARETKRRIFEAAMDRMREKGYYGTRIEDVCQAAQVSVGTFYHHYDSKLDIFSFTYAEADEYFENEVAPRLAAEAPERRILAYFDLYAEFNKRMGVDFVKVLYHGDNTWFTKKDRAMQRVLREQIADAQAAGTLDPTISASDLTESLFVLARGAVYDWCIHNGSYDLTESLERLMNRMLKGFQSPSSYR